MIEKQNTDGESQGQDINDLIKQLQDSQGEGDALFMFGHPAIDETQVDETLLQEMLELDKTLEAKFIEMESKYDAETLRNTSMKSHINSGHTELSNFIDETKVNEVLLQEMTDFGEALKTRTSQWDEKYSPSVIQNTALKHRQM